MSTRRRFVAGASAAVTTVAAVSGVGCLSALRRRTRVRSAERREETIRRYAGSGDNWHMSWAADDRQYMSLCDGFGFSGQSRYLYNANVVAVEGGPERAVFREMAGYPHLAYSSQKLADTRYYPFGTLALNGHIYQFMSTFNRPLVPADIGRAMQGAEEPGELRFCGAKLIYSPDGGMTWCNQDGSSPVVWESWSERSRERLAFFEEPEEAFSLVTVLQMGRNYELNRDGYVYLYAPNGNTDGTMNELVLCRVPIARIRSRGAYEYFAGTRAGGRQRWSRHIDARKPVHTFPLGWVNKRLHPFAWHPSVVYNAPLGLFLMANWGMGCSADGDWFGKASYLGFWTAPDPWGPWTQIHEETAWMPGGEPAARAYEPQIAPKWIAPDGKSFWLVWTDAQMKGDKAEYERLNAPLKQKIFDDFTLADWRRRAEIYRRFTPYYSLNAQRVDLTVA